MESVQKILEVEVTKLLQLIPPLIPTNSRKLMGPLANSLKLTTRMVSDFPKSELKGVEWLLDVVGLIAPQALGQLTETQLRTTALKFIDLGLLIMDNLPPEIEGGEINA